MDKQKIAKETAEVVEKTLDVLEDVDQQIVTVVKNNPLVLVGVGVVSLAAGVGAGWFAATKYLTPKYEALVKEEIETAQDYYARLNKAGPYATPEGAVKALHDDEDNEFVVGPERLGEEVAEMILEEAAIAQRSYDKMFTGTVEVVEGDAGTTIVETTAQVDLEDGSVEVTQKETSNIFLNGNPVDADFDPEVEAEKRSAGKPYIITEDEFMTNANEDEEISCTYYAADDTLTDHKDKTIDDIEGNVGEANLKQFGRGSNDRNMLFVRNEAKGTIYEIARSGGSYMREVLGMDEDEVPKRRVRRGGDE